MMVFLPKEEMRFFTDVKEHSAVFGFRVRMSENVDIDALSGALRSTLELFPRFGMRPYKSRDGHEIILKDNPAGLPVFTDDVPRALGTDETNGYLFRVSAIGDSLAIFFFHALTDGMGGQIFLRHFLFFYARETGHDVENDGSIYTTEDLAGPAYSRTITDYMEENEEALKAPEDPEVSIPDNVFSVPEISGMFYEDSFYKTGIDVDMKQWMEIVHGNDTTPVCMAFVLLSRAIRKQYSVSDQPILCYIAVDIRKRTGSISLTEMSTYSYLFYLPEWDEMSVKDACLQVRGLLNKVTRDGEIIKTFDNSFQVAMAAKQYIDLNDSKIKLFFVRKAESKPDDYPFISNMGLFKIPQEMNDLVCSVEEISVPVKKSMDISMFGFRDTLRFTFCSNGKDDTLKDAFCDELSCTDIDIKHKDACVMSLDYLGEIPREDE
ncbi:MAG: hypothetical protein K5888_10940 [Lachnospiraceae bacterium]|nr:hypothetical protein [Lachnospiraceae bacterium]